MTCKCFLNLNQHFPLFYFLHISVLNTIQCFSCTKISTKAKKWEKQPKLWIQQKLCNLTLASVSSDTLMSYKCFVSLVLCLLYFSLFFLTIFLVQHFFLFDTLQVVKRSARCLSALLDSLPLTAVFWLLLLYTLHSVYHIRMYVLFVLITKEDMPMPSVVQLL